MGYTQETGDFAEQLACDYLIENGLELVKRNYRCRFGEIDLVMKQNESFVFVEVRSRKKNTQVDAVTSVDGFKQQKLIRSAEYYLQQNRVHQDISARFDVIAITHQSLEKPAINWIQNAIEG